MTDSCMLCHLRTRELCLSMDDLEISLQFLSLHWTWERARHTVRILRKCRELCDKLRAHTKQCSYCLRLTHPVIWKVENWKSTASSRVPTVSAFVRTA